MFIFDLLIVATVLGFFLLSAVDMALRLVNLAKPSIKAAALATKKPVKPPVPTIKTLTSKQKSKATVADVIRQEVAFRSVGSAAVNYSSMSVRELRALCQADKTKFAGYSPYVKKGQAALVEFMQSR